jgi:hypothetical protein
MKNLAGFLAAIACSCPIALPAQWETSTFGSGGSFTQGLCLGRAHPDGKVRLHALAGWGGDGKGLEWTYSDGVWSSVQVYSGLGVCYSPVVGAIRAPGESALYLGSYSEDQLFEYFRGAGGWSGGAIPGSRIAQYVCVRIAAGRNDGVPRLYASNADSGGPGGLSEFSWSPAGGAWEKLDVWSKDVGGFAVADGRGDGVLRIYAGSRSGGDGGFLEITWSGDRYAAEVIRLDGILTGRIQTTHAGDGRGDGKVRLYAHEWGGRLYELTFEGGSWTPLQVATGGNRFYLASGRLHPDNRSRLYSTIQGSGTYEHDWNGTGYTTSVDAITSATGMIAIGDGRNDGKNRLYIGRGDRSPIPAAVIELSDPDPPDADEPVPASEFRRGDGNGDGDLDISDAVLVLFFLFAGDQVAAGCEDALDADDTGLIEVTDAVAILEYLYLDGQVPPAPFPGCGPDPTVDVLACRAAPGCGTAR